MKAFTLIVFGLAIISNISCQDDELPGLLADYSFSGNTLDQSGNANHAVVLGASSTRDRFNAENSAYLFDGLKSIITADVGGMPAVDAPQSISLWFRIDTIPHFKHEMDAHNMIALVDTNAGVGVQFGFRAPGYNSLGFDVWYWGGRTIMESEIPAINQWFHCVYTFDATHHQFFFNGKMVAESTVQPQTGRPDMLMLGNYTGGDQYFAGRMDDVRIYNRNLSKLEINKIYSDTDKTSTKE